MRNIKFRGWNKTQKKMYFWDKEPYLSFFIGDYGDIFANAFKEANATEFMQYIGLKDMKERDIYEGDILRCEKDTGGGIVIEWREVEIDKDSTYLGWGICRENAEQMIVVGNIYENPDLL